MAITKILNIKETKGRNPATHLEIALNYIQNPDKTEKCVLVGSVNCLPDTAFQQMVETKELYQKTGKRQGYHVIISFSPEEKVTAEQVMYAYNWSLVENKQRFISQVMTSKAVSRSCEDIDEATLSYAEIKAVATGNPLIKEKMEIDNDVQRLKLLKASYDNQRYGLQDNFMIKYPKLIKTATEKLANVREDVKARDKELIDNPEFAITIGKATYTERVDGGTMMLEAISKCKTGETTVIGKFHGFELLVEKNFLGINYMVLRGKTEYKAELSTSPVGSMVKLENLFNGLHENIDFLEKKIEQYQNDLEASKSEYDKPFAYSTELEEKLARQCELNAQLDLENAKAVDADLSGPGEEREADDRMESAAIVAEDKGAYQADREGRTR